MLNVMTWNIKHSTPVSDVVMAVGRAVEQNRVDVLCLQEVRLLSWGEGYTGLPSKLARATGMHVASVLHPVPNGSWWEGLTVLSRYPILRQRNRLLSWHRSYLEVTIRTPGGERQVVCAHVSALSQELRAKEVRRLMRLVPDRRVIVAGDFNLTLDSPTLEPMLRRMWVDGCAAASFGSSRNRRKIDHVFISPDLVMSFAVALPPDISDHNPVLAVVG